MRPWTTRSVTFWGVSWETRRGPDYIVAVQRLGKLLRHRRLVRGGADGSAIRGGRPWAEARSIRGPELSAFGTPTIVHFCAVLLISAIVSVPWHAVSSAGLALGASGLAGIIYMLVVIGRARGQSAGQKGYKPVLEDWLWHTAFPFIAYVTLLVASITLRQDPPDRSW